jgi:multidrug resistance efflux pump
MFFRKSCDECEGYKAEIDRLRTQLVKAETKIAQLSDALEAKAGHEDDLDNCQPTDRGQATKSDVAECIHQGDRRVLENSVTAEQNELDTRRTSAVAKSGMSNRQWLDHKVAEHQKRQAKKEQAYAQDKAENIRLACQNHAVTLIRNFRKC